MHAWINNLDTGGNEYFHAEQTRSPLSPQAGANGVDCRCQSLLRCFFPDPPPKVLMTTALLIALIYRHIAQPGVVRARRAEHPRSWTNWDDEIRG